MREIRSSQRRRRLRLIREIEQHHQSQFQQAAAALTIASDTQAARLDASSIRAAIMAECRTDRSAVLRIEHRGAEPMTVALDRPSLLIGSDPSCDVHLDHGDVSSRHCLLQWIEGHVYCCETGPRVARHAQSALENGRWLSDEVYEVGPFRLSLVEPMTNPFPEFSPLDRDPDLAHEFPILAFRFKDVEQSENLWPINRRLTLIGRGSQCKLRLNHADTPYAQASLLRTAKGCWLTDLTHDGSLRLNQRPIEVAPIDIGDEIQFGAFLVEVVTLATSKDSPKAVLSNGDADRTPVRIPWSAAQIVDNAMARQQEFNDSERKDASVATIASVPVTVPLSADTTMAELLAAQQRELAQLREQLESLKSLYHAAGDQRV